MNLGAEWTPNPVFVRETRGRWRGRAFIVLFGYVSLLAIIILITYATSAPGTITFIPYATWRSWATTCL